MEILYHNISGTSTMTNNESIDLWLTLISIIIAIISIIISTGFAWKSYRQEKREIFQKKKEFLFDLFNNFLLYLETIANAKSYGITKYNPKDTEIDFKCLDAMGKIHCFSYINNLSIKNDNRLNDFINLMFDLSNDIQDARKIKENEIQLIALKEIDNRIKSLRTHILNSITYPNFFRQKNKK